MGFLVNQNCCPLTEAALKWYRLRIFAANLLEWLQYTGVEAPRKGTPPSVSSRASPTRSARGSPPRPGLPPLDLASHYVPGSNVEVNAKDHSAHSEDPIIACAVVHGQGLEPISYLRCAVYCLSALLLNEYSSLEGGYFAGLASNPQGGSTRVHQYECAQQLVTLCCRRSFRTTMRREWA